MSKKQINFTSYLTKFLFTSVICRMAMIRVGSDKHILSALMIVLHEKSQDHLSYKNTLSGKHRYAISTKFLAKPFSDC